MQQPPVTPAESVTTGLGGGLSLSAGARGASVLITFEAAGLSQTLTTDYPGAHHIADMIRGAAEIAEEFANREQPTLFERDRSELLNALRALVRVVCEPGGISSLGGSLALDQARRVLDRFPS